MEKRKLFKDNGKLKLLIIVERDRDYLTFQQ